jgi:hypothetical protein
MLNYATAFFPAYAESLCLLIFSQQGRLKLDDFTFKVAAFEDKTIHAGT